MVKAKSRNAPTWEYVLREHRDLDESERPVWTLQGLPQRALLELANSTKLEVDENGDVRPWMQLGTQTRIALRYGLVSVTNLEDPDTGQPLVARGKGSSVVLDSFLERVDWGWQQELGAQILSGGGPLTADDVEKPEPSHTG